MKHEHGWIVGLLVVGIGLYALVQGVILPKQALQEAEYVEAQRDPTTHDLKRILPYKHPYMGNAANLGNLFDHLPLAHLQRTYQLHPETLTAEIHYQVAASQVEGQTLYKSLIYNAVASFALIDNLERLHFNFKDKVYATTRDGMELVFGRDLSALLTEEAWKTVVQQALLNPDFVQQVLKVAFTVESGK